MKLASVFCITLTYFDFFFGIGAGSTTGGRSQQQQESLPVVPFSRVLLYSRSTVELRRFERVRFAVSPIEDSSILANFRFLLLLISLSS